MQGILIKVYLIAIYTSCVMDRSNVTMDAMICDLLIALLTLVTYRASSTLMRGHSPLGNSSQDGLYM